MMVTTPMVMITSRNIRLSQKLFLSGPFSASAHFPIDFRPRSLAFTEIGAAWTVPLMTARIRACLVNDGRRDCARSDMQHLTDRGFIVTGAGGGKAVTGAYTLRDYYPYGKYDALFTAESSTELSRLRAGVLDNFL